MPIKGAPCDGPCWLPWLSLFPETVVSMVCRFRLWMTLLMAGVHFFKRHSLTLLKTRRDRSIDTAVMQPGCFAKHSVPNSTAVVYPTG